MASGATTGVARAADTPARIALLSSGERASVVVEFESDFPKATAVETADPQLFDVEIGPVQSRVANQLLQAASQSPLVTEVRVRGVPQGTRGTLIVLRVTAKAPVSGLVRRARRRVYIDLEPLSIVSASKQSVHPAAAPAATPAAPAAGTTPGTITTRPPGAVLLAAPAAQPPPLSTPPMGDATRRGAELPARQSDADVETFRESRPAAAAAAMPAGKVVGGCF
jgi:hypothetical protein